MTGPRRKNHLLRVLTYHRVETPEARPDLYPGLISATPHDFDQQMRLLAGQYQVVSLPEVIGALQNEEPLPPRAVLITFDDAYRDFADNAWPVLRRYGLAATLFVPTAFPGDPLRPFWWDRLHQMVTSASQSDKRASLETPLGPLPIATDRERRDACRQLNGYVKTLPHREAMAFVTRLTGDIPCIPNHVMDWDTLRRLAREGVTLGAHTRTHPLMNRVSPDEARAEILDSRSDLEREIGPVPPIFAYPSGHFDACVVDILDRAGFALAFTTIRGINDLGGADRLRLRRINVGRRTTLPVLRAQLASLSLALNRWQPLPAGRG